jgi:hypothetical protein
MKRIISFALWGQNTLYTHGAVRNAERYAEFYPGWTCRFYHDDTVPSDILEKIAATGAEMWVMGRSTDVLGMYWRFHPMFDDPQVERFIVRDTDSFFTKREAMAVQEWIDSGLPFHIMRDNQVHNVSILGGTWGAVPGCVPNFQRRLSMWMATVRPQPKNDRGLFHGTDQIFLHCLVWPEIRDKHMAHVREGMEHLKCTTKDRWFPVPVETENGHYVGMVA